MKQLEVVAAIIIYNEQILGMQRNKGDYDYISYKFEFPGGKIEKGETKTEALMRELQEEMNISINIMDKDFFFRCYHKYPDFEVTIDSFLCYVDSPEFVQKEHIAHKWLHLKELDDLDWAGADIPIVERLLEMKKDGLSR